MADKKFVVSPMEYKSGPENPKPPGVYDGDPNFPKRSDYGAGVTEKTLESWPTEKSDAMGSPVISKDTTKG
jgi:hypothetical protein